MPHLYPARQGPPGGTIPEEGYSLGPQAAFHSPRGGGADAYFEAGFLSDLATLSFQTLKLSATEQDSDRARLCFMFHVRGLHVVTSQFHQSFTQLRRFDSPPFSTMRK